MPYTKTVWANNVTPALNATNLNHLTDEIKAQALAKGISHSLPTWANGVPPAVSEAAPLNEMERVAKAVQVALGIASYTVTTWQANWTPARNAVNLNKLEEQVRLNRVAIGGAPAFPASYFTGPLGANNIVPATLTGSLLNLWSGTSTTVADSRLLIQQRMTDTARSFDCIGTKIGSNVSTDDSYSTGGTGGRGETWIHSLGSVPIMSWDWNVTPASVASGSQDASLATLAARLGGAGFRIILRIWREQNIQSGTNFFTGGSGNTQPQLDQIAADWIAGWRYFVNYFQTHGATNVGFCWSPSEKASRVNTSQTGRDQLLATYPGDAYVDWIAVDGYNHSRTDVFSTPLHNGWASFNEVFNYQTLGYANPAFVDEYTTKPFYTWETGSKYDSGTPTRKATWFKDIDDVAKDSMPRLQGVQFFDNWVSAESNDWRVDHNQVGGIGVAQGSVDATTYNGFINLAGRTRWNVGVAGGAT